jgi:guanylate kinase
MNKLEKIDEFKNIIDGYSPSQSSLDILKKVKLTLLVAPSSTGRNTVIKELVKENDFSFIVTDSTREPRANNGIMEVNGREYWFKTEDEFLDGLRDGLYLEAEIIHAQQVCGISIKELKVTLSDSKIAITDVDIGGVKSIIKYKPDVNIIMLLPPSFEEWISRLKGRGEMAQEEVRRRLTTAITIFKSGLVEPYYNFVIARNVNESANHIREISLSSSQNSPISDKVQNLLKELITDTEKYLN